MSEPAFYTIITVSRNNLAGLKATARSVLAQRCTDYEWIVIDGASTDGTCGYLGGLPTLWVSEPDSGIYDAMNKGLEKACGRYVIFMNAGDVFADEQVLSDILQRIQSCAVLPGFIYGDSFEILPGGAQHFKAARSHKAIDWGLFTHHQAMFYGRNAFKELRYDLNYKIAADYDLTRRFLKRLRAEEIQYFPRVICAFEAGGISQQNAEAGRREQFESRKMEGVISSFKNRLIRIVQFLNWELRRCFPQLYWLLKR